MRRSYENRCRARFRRSAKAKNESRETSYIPRVTRQPDDLRARAPPGPAPVSLNGENIVLPFAFERAGVKDAAVAEGARQNVADVTFDEDGTAVLHALSEEQPKPEVWRAW